ncbi:MAG: hypothetical protein C5B43_00590 [Verrucomicrobia bacterium]|nr:MAG: hypothetical protein C5B43_00590 [Verrucomicrobiota bacterium]
MLIIIIMKIKIKNIIVFIIVSMIFGFIYAEEDPRGGVSKITITNHTPYGFNLAFIPGKQKFSDQLERKEQSIIVKVDANGQKSVSANLGERLAYEGSEFGIEAIDVKDPDIFQETLDWKSNPLIFGFGFYAGGYDFFWHTSVIVKLQYINKDNLQIDITEGEPLRSPQKY